MFGTKPTPGMTLAPCNFVTRGSADTEKEQTPLKLHLKESLLLLLFLCSTLSSVGLGDAGPFRLLCNEKLLKDNKYYPMVHVWTFKSKLLCGSFVSSAKIHSENPKIAAQ